MFASFDEGQVITDLYSQLTSNLKLLLPQKHGCHDHRVVTLVADKLRKQCMTTHVIAQDTTG